MKAAFYRRFGGPEVLLYGDLPEPKLAQNSVLIRVKAAALNPADLALQSGLGDSIMETWFPVVPGWDVAGIIEQVGAGVTEFAPGDEVLAYARQDILHAGTCAELVSLPVELPCRKPPELGWEEAAGLPLAGLTAHRGIVRTLKVGRGDRVLVLGASGGVGSVAVQLAREAGAMVMGSASLPNHDYVRSLGAHPVGHGEDLVRAVRHRAPEGVTAILDCAGHGQLEFARQVATAHTRLCSITSGGPGVTTAYARTDPAVLGELVSRAAAGRLRITIAAAYPLWRAAEGQRALNDHRHGPGKIVLVPGAGS
ncbi:MAG: NADP-dependent oxidoreductase [Holophaga sp.]|nr:NADP-dependent oxidoreductase [Holophaga sp.]